MNHEKRRAFDQAAGVLNSAFEQAGPFPGQEVTPPLLTAAVRQCLEICQQIDAAGDDMPLWKMSMNSAAMAWSVCLTWACGPIS